MLNGRKITGVRIHVERAILHLAQVEILITHRVHPQLFNTLRRRYPCYRQWLSKSSIFYNSLLIGLINNKNIVIQVYTNFNVTLWAKQVHPVRSPHSSSVLYVCQKFGREIDNCCSI